MPPLTESGTHVVLMDLGLQQKLSVYTLPSQTGGSLDIPPYLRFPINNHIP